MDNENQTVPRKKQSLLLVIYPLPISPETLVDIECQSHVG